MARSNNEHYEQVALFQWIDIHKDKHKGLDLTFAVPNGANTSPRIGKWMKEEGLKPGVPDVVLPLARQGYIGLWIEMKVDKNKPTKVQLDFHGRLREEGHKVVVCYNWEEARIVIMGYLKRV